MARGRPKAGQLGHVADEPDLAHGLAIGQIEELANGGRVLRGQKDAVDKVLDVNAIEGLFTRAEVGERPPPKVHQQLGQDGAIALAIDEARADDGRGQRALFVVFQDEGLGLSLGAGVSVKRAGRRRDGLVGAVMVATRVDAQRADVHESLDLSVAGRVEE